MFVKSASFEALGLMHIQPKFSSLFRKLSSNHPELTRDFLKLSANINVPGLFRCSLPHFKQDASILLLSTKSKPLFKQYFRSLSLTARISSDLSTSSQLNFSFIVYFLDGGNNIPNFVHSVYPISKVICSRMNMQKVRFPPNTWLDIINSCCTRICSDLDMIFLGNFETCQIFNYRIANYDDAIC